ncbi:MAG TPA: orotidine-5'-phosphate decarboxylase [Pyrinomonadaceae bacterium]|nr:orotidine-5'-phosphate decarboxylase [Pyrinomonadaceae bacterium]
MDARNKLIVALDVENANQALKLFDSLHHSVGMFKIGMQLFTAAGPDIVRQIVSRGGRVFLDLKYHDIPNTVARAAIEATRLGVTLFNIHASGGREMMERTAGAVSEVASRENLAKPRILGVTVLTSIDQETLRQIGIADEPAMVVRRLASLAQASGLDGVVASAQEIKIIRDAISHPDFLIVTPGIRAATGEAHDQRRTMTAGEAIRAGADYLVVGRPILAAADPVSAAEEFVSEIDEGLRTRPAQPDFAEQSRVQSVQ